VKSPCREVSHSRFQPPAPALPDGRAARVSASGLWIRSRDVKTHVSTSWNQKRNRSRSDAGRDGSALEKMLRFLYKEAVIPFPIVIRFD
jgi:hypothetical protein